MPYTAYNSVAKMGLAASGGSVKEQYIPLWVFGIGTVSTTTTSGAGNFIQKGSTNNSGTVSSTTKLHTLSSGWSSSQRFALEASIYNSGSGGTSNVAIWDMTSNTLVSGSQASMTGSMATLIRSASFTLVPGHSYGVTFWGSAGTTYLTKAHLVATN